MKIIDISISNILSIEDAKLSFEDSGLVLVEGWNYDSDRANGAGKTAIFNALSFALFDKIPRKITASEILRRGTKSGFAEVTLKVADAVWTVKRYRPKNVEFHKDGKKLDITQEEFESNIRLTYDQFILTVYNAQNNAGNSRFIICSDTDKKSFLSQLLNIDGFADLKKSADEVVKKLTADSEALNLKLRSAESKIEAYRESLVDSDEIVSQIKEYEAKLNKVNKEIIDLSKVEKPNLSKFRQLEDDLVRKQTNIYETKLKLNNLKEKFRELSTVSAYDPNRRCSECGASLDTPEARKLHKQSHDAAISKAKDIKAQIDELERIVAKEKDLKDLSQKLRDKKAEASSDYQSAVERIAELKSFASVAESKVANLKTKLNSNNELQEKIRALSAFLSDGAVKSKDYINSIELYKTLSSIFSPTGAQAYILDSVVESFNEIVQRYVDIVWPNVSYSLQSQKETSKGDVVAKFSENLVMDGKEISTGSLSGGELRALSLCVDFALLEVLATRFGISVNPIILDEPFDGLDTVGREIVISLLSSLAKDHQILVVDHASESKVLFSKVIKVEKRGGISTIKVET